MDLQKVGYRYVLNASVKNFYMNHLQNDVSSENVTLHEPPRRVLVELPHSRVTLSDYLFPGEGPQESLKLLKELLDLEVLESQVQKDVEEQVGKDDVVLYDYFTVVCITFLSKNSVYCPNEISLLDTRFLSFLNEKNGKNKYFWNSNNFFSLQIQQNFMVKMK